MSTLPDPAWAALDRQHAWHPYTQHGVDPEPLPVVGAQGAWLTLANGQRMLDAISSWWCCLHGHGRAELVQALERQARTLDHVLFAGCAHEGAAHLAARLTALAPGELTRCFFSDDGSTSVEVALKAAYVYHRRRGAPERTQFLALQGGYHGDTFGAMSVSDPVPFFQDVQPLLFGVSRSPLDAAQLTQAAHRLGPKLVAIVLEPQVQGAAGMRSVPAELVRAARRACDDTGALLIADEVMTGFGRTGKTFALEHSGVAPDLLCLAKGLTGGMLPLAVTLATEVIYEAFLGTQRSQMLFHGHTFTANPLACAVALASLDLLEAQDTPGKLDQIGRWIEGALRAGPLEPGQVVRRIGGIVALQAHPEATGYAATPSEALRERARRLAPDVLLRPLGGVLYAMPPACTTQPECERIAERMIQVASTR